MLLETPRTLHKTRRGASLPRIDEIGNSPDPVFELAEYAERCKGSTLGIDLHLPVCLPMETATSHARPLRVRLVAWVPLLRYR